MSMIRAIVITLILSTAGCDSNSLTEAQSEMASYCMVMMSTADTAESIELFRMIISHMDERGVRKSAVEEGAIRAAKELESGDKKSIARTKIAACREVLSW